MTITPIHFQGLNCYHDCIISLANYFQVNYCAAFATLWSETDFRYDPYREAYLTKRMLINLEALGMSVENLGALSLKEAENVSRFYEGEFIIVGIDAFYIPWNQFYQLFHGPHYLIVQNAKEEYLPCVDPTYNKSEQAILRRDIIEHTFDVSRISRAEKKTPMPGGISEACEIVRTHPATCQNLRSRIYECRNESRENIILLAKYMDTMICNRYLYRFFMKEQAAIYAEDNLFWSNDFFKEWKAVKNGLYKLAVSRSKERLSAEVSDHLSHLLAKELAMAQKLIERASLYPA